MAIKVKKKKKKKGLGGLGSRAGSGQEQSSRRPQKIEKTAPCMAACPNKTNIRKIITTIAQAEKKEKSYDQAYAEAWDILAEKNPFPSVCGRVCPHPCEEQCNRKAKDGAVAINSIERFIGDYALEHNLPLPGLSTEKRSEKIAVIGGGPAGFSCAYQLRRLGYPVTVFEAFPKAGGMLRYGIPDYRLPQDVLDAEIKRLTDMGIELKTNTVIGKDIDYHDLQKEYKAIFVGIGAHKGYTLGIEGEDAENVWTGTEFLNKINCGQTIDVGDNVYVIGGGDTAIDAARVCRRLGAEVTILYRRTRNEMPAIEEEIVGAEEEGVKFVFLAAPIAITKEGDKAVKMTCQKMELGEPDSSGRRRPVPIEGETFEVEMSTLIPAISQEPEFEGFENLREGRDWIKTDDSFKTKEENVFSGGDVLELGLVTIAIYQGRIAAYKIHEEITGEKIVGVDENVEHPVIKEDKILLDYYEEKMRHEAQKLEPSERLKSLEKEITETFTEQDCIDEAKRCFSCGSCFECGQCWSYCQDNAVVKPLKPGDTYTFKLEFCKGCDKCAENCPCGYIEMH
ncbi:MAG TPA: FAD-dependent oxidoreductase [candidate division Zixibacteria bacterium]|nr:FAD-dependent oxidoreductase [candidate division Zixibacteria bacterium]